MTIAKVKIPYGSFIFKKLKLPIICNCCAVVVRTPREEFDVEYDGSGIISLPRVEMKEDEEISVSARS